MMDSVSSRPASSHGICPSTDWESDIRRTSCTFYERILPQIEKIATVAVSQGSKGDDGLGFVETGVESWNMPQYGLGVRYSTNFLYILRKNSTSDREDREY